MSEIQCQKKTRRDCMTPFQHQPGVYYEEIGLMNLV